MERIQQTSGTRRWAGIRPRDLITVVVIGAVIVGTSRDLMKKKLAKIM